MSVAMTAVGTAGNLHAGSGNQYIVEMTRAAVEALARDHAGRTPGQVAKDHLLHLLPRFEPPTGYARAHRRLEEEGVVLLDGAPGTGRTATAQVLLRNHAPRRVTFHEIVHDDTRQRLFDPERIGEYDRLLLDLSGAPLTSTQGFEGELSSVLGLLKQRRAALVVILPTSAARGLPSSVAHLAVTITRPPDAEIRVVRRFLRLSGNSERETVPLPASLKQFVDDCHSLDDVAGFARVVSEAVADGTPFDAACDMAVDALRDRSGDAAVLLGTVRDSRTRGLLVASALMEGARSDAVHEAASALHRRAGGEAGPPLVLAARPLSVRFGAIKVEIDAAGRVHFADRGLADALSRQIWRDFPDLRGTLRAWVEEILLLPRLDGPEREALVHRFAAHSLREGHHADLERLSEYWSKSSNPREQRAAVGVLSAALSDRAAAADFRAYLLRRARQETLTRPERQVLVAVCRGDLAVHHPFAAVVRLHHLARREAPGTVAGDALMGLAGEGRRLLRFLLGRLTHSSDEERHRVPDAELFLRCVDSPHVHGGSGAEGRPLAVDPAVRADLATGWAGAFACLDAGRWFPCARGWFDAAARDGDALGLVDVLLDACRGRSSAQGLLYQAALRWAATRPAEDAAASALPGAVLRRVKETHSHRAARARGTSTP
ncbi:hypothetical protein [Streptomyces tremellae]|uniref:AAA+ ATPase domain-containing protein n=1 Tax=Streptomyces tremellae TaxID=1124239 RepID=A0ABP7F2L6_9ACTN